MPIQPGHPPWVNTVNAGDGYGYRDINSANWQRSTENCTNAYYASAPR